MNIIGVNNTRPGNQGATVYFDGMDMEFIAEALVLLHERYAGLDFADDDGVPDHGFRDHLMGEIARLQNQFADLNTYLDGINPNLAGGEGL